MIHRSLLLEISLSRSNGSRLRIAGTHSTPTAIFQILISTPSYLLASGLSSISGTACPAPRITLFGLEHPAQARSFHTDLLSVVLSEVAEYGLSLTPPVKGQEPYPGLPHLQPYRLWHTACLMETGDVSLALRLAGHMHVPTKR